MTKWLAEYKAGDDPVLKQFVESQLLFQPDRFDTNQRLITMKWPWGISDCIVRCGDAFALPLEKGYRIIDVQSYSEDEFNACLPMKSRLADDKLTNFISGRVFARLCVLEREVAGEEFDGHPCRLAILWVHEDGVSLYDRLFANRNVNMSSVMVVHGNYGFGEVGRYMRGGACSLISARARAWPEYLLTDQEPWLGYVRCSEFEQYQMGNDVLYRLIPQHEEYDVYMSIRDPLNQVDMLRIEAPPLSHLRLQILNWCRRNSCSGEVLQKMDDELLLSFLEGEWTDDSGVFRNCLPPLTDAYKLLDIILHLRSPYKGDCWIVVRRR